MFKNLNNHSLNTKGLKKGNLLVVVVHVMLCLFVFLFANKLYSYQTEIYKYEQNRDELYLNKNLLDEVKSNKSYILSKSYVLKIMRQNANVKNNGERVLDLSSAENNNLYKVGDYLPETVYHKQEKITHLWRDCLTQGISVDCKLD